MKFKVIYKSRSTFPSLIGPDSVYYKDYGDETIEAPSIVEAQKIADEHTKELGKNIVATSISQFQTLGEDKNE